MHQTRQQDLPFKGSSHQFVGADQGGVEFESGAGDIFVIEAGEVHEFKCVGDAPLVQLDVHLSPTFIQENLGGV